jgi:hypothetical protein
MINRVAFVGKAIVALVKCCKLGGFLKGKKEFSWLAPIGFLE